MRNGRSVALGVWVVLGAFACSDASGGCGWWYDDPDRQHMPRPQKVRPDGGCDGGACPTDASTPKDAGSLPRDGGSGTRDGGLPAPDAGTSAPDASLTPADGGGTDAGSPASDAAVPSADGASGLPSAPLRDPQSFVGACDTRAREGECIDLHGAFDPVLEEAACGSSGGAWSSAPCPTAGRIGRCTVNADLGDGPVAHVLSYYDAPQLVDALEAACTEVGGFWDGF